MRPDHTTILCACGCGQPAPIATRNNATRGYVKGQPVAYIKGHRAKRDMRSLADRFWEKVDKTGDCWVWTAYLTPNGYGQIEGPAPEHKALLAHRVAYEITYGPIPDGLHVCHRCDNRQCVRPDHLFLGTHQDNMTDRNQKGRQYNVRRGEIHGSARFTDEQVSEMRQLYAQGYTTGQIGEIFGASYKQVWAIVHHKQWKHLD